MWVYLQNVAEETFIFFLLGRNPEINQSIVSGAIHN